MLFRSLADQHQGAGGQILLPEAVEGQVAAAGDVAGGELMGFAHIDHGDPPGGELLGQVLGGEVWAHGGKGWQERDEQRSGNNDAQIGQGRGGQDGATSSG